ncbi:MAG: hypothetical protein IKQ90_05070 [Ruminococcus sp.]|nr:hypothetical protein [Ruminococcus sp.]
MKCKKCGSDWNSASGKVLTKCPFCNADLTEKEDINDSEAVRAIKDIIKKYGVSVMNEKARFIGLFGDYAPKLAHEKRILQLALDENTAKFFVNCKEAEREKNLAKAQNLLLEVLNEKTVREILEIFVGMFKWKVKMPQTAQKPEPKNNPPAPKPIPPVPKPAPNPLLLPKSQPVPPAHKPNTKNITIIINDVTFGKGMYVGQINSNRQPHGYGKVKYDSGYIYDGQWKNGKYNGTGTMIYVYGDVYYGEWKNGLRHGKGKITSKNKDVYEGEWKDGYQHGKGKKTYADGTILEGRWEKGIFKNKVK